MRSSKIYSPPRIKSLALLFVIIMSLATLVQLNLYFCRYNTKGDDIYYIWKDSQTIASGKNPYERILSGNMVDNRKYITYFPLFYCLVALSQVLGLKELSYGIFFWRSIFVIFDFGIAALIFDVFYKKKRTILALFFALFWLFNRWTLNALLKVYPDFMAIFFLVVSLKVFPDRRLLSLLLLSLSLAIKQIGIFLVPLYLIWTWQQPASHKKKIMQLGKALILVVSIPLFISLPFILTSPLGFIKSILFSLTRNLKGSFYSWSIAEFLGLTAVGSRLPMLALMIPVYLAAFRKQLTKFTSVFLIFVLFVDFSPLLFDQYFCWLTPFIPLSIAESLDYFSVSKKPKPD
ncbi:MAG TPA: hypothetical protein VMW41_04100 [Candidatus Bathyarchaeia archaeon]|nr:hypothetical protein [Candidatus Bathyarchaeia archaeon]